MAITYEQIVKANSLIAKTYIKGKDYAEVNQRVKAFRFLYPTGKIETVMKSCENGICIFEAKIFDEAGNLLSTGNAYEKENSTFINKTSYIENCETSAVGRALGFLGLGIDTSISSYEEVANAKANQDEKQQKNNQKTTKKQASQNVANEVDTDAQRAFEDECNKWVSNRTELEALGCDFRDPKVDAWIIGKAKVKTQKIEEFDVSSVADLSRLNAVYAGMIARKRGS